jgi:hypothetical protein
LLALYADLMLGVVVVRHLALETLAAVWTFRDEQNLFERIPRCFANKLDSFVLAGLGTCAFVATASLKYRKGCMPRPPTEILCGLSVRHVQSRRLPK